MKKLIALMLSLMLLVGLALPMMAEEDLHKHEIVYDDTMTVVVVIPEGYAIQENNVAGSLVMVLAPIDESNNYYCIMIAPDEDYAEVERLNDLTDEQVLEIANDFATDMNNPTITYSETGMGTKLIVLDDNDVELGDTAAVLTLYKGYFLSTYVFPAGDTVTEDELNKAIQFYTDMEFMF